MIHPSARLFPVLLLLATALGGCLDSPSVATGGPTLEESTDLDGPPAGQEGASDPHRYVLTYKESYPEGDLLATIKVQGIETIRIGLEEWGETYRVDFTFEWQGQTIGVLMWLDAALHVVRYFTCMEWHPSQEQCLSDDSKGAGWSHTPLVPPYGLFWPLIIGDANPETLDVSDQRVPVTVDRHRGNITNITLDYGSLLAIYRYDGEQYPYVIDFGSNQTQLLNAERLSPLAEIEPIPPPPPSSGNRSGVFHDDDTQVFPRQVTPDAVIEALKSSRPEVAQTLAEGGCIAGFLQAARYASFELIGLVGLEFTTRNYISVFDQYGSGQSWRIDYVEDPLFGPSWQVENPEPSARELSCQDIAGLGAPHVSLQAASRAIRSLSIPAASSEVGAIDWNINRDAHTQKPYEVYVVHFVPPECDSTCFWDRIGVRPDGRFVGADVTLADLRHMDEGA